MSEWRLVVLRPIVLLVWLNAGAATCLFGLATTWTLTNSWALNYPIPTSPLPWVLGTLGLGGILSLVSFVGNWTLEKR